MSTRVGSVNQSSTEPGHLTPPPASKTLWWIALAIPLLSLGCGSAQYYGELRSETDVPAFASLLAEIEVWSTRTTLLETRIEDGPPVGLALHETGNPQADRVIVLIHGAFSDHEGWRFLNGALASDYSLVMVDLPGCGASDRPDPASLGPDGFTPGAMTERILQALGTHFSQARDDRPITLVGHSLGGTLALHMIGNQSKRERHAAVLDRVDRLVLLAPADVEFVNPPALFVSIATLDGFAVELAALLGILREKISLGTLHSVDSPDRALREEANKRYDQLVDRGTREALQAMLTQAVPMTPEGKPDWPRIESFIADYANVRLPCLILWGAHDETLGVSMGFKLANQIPHARLRVIDDCKHSVHLEHPRLCGQIIDDFNRIDLASHQLETLAPLEQAGW